jgi:hypothetical protein
MARSRELLQGPRHEADRDRMRFRLLLVTALVPLAAACGLAGSQSKEAQVKACQDDLVGEARELSGDDPYFSTEEARAKIRRACVELIAAGVDDARDKEKLQAFVETHPDVAGDVCAFTAPVAYKRLPAAERRYVTVADMERLAREGCRHSAAEGYGAIDGELDLPGLFKAHPVLAEPFCTAGTMNVYDTEYTRAQKKSLPRKGFNQLASRVCIEAIRTGIMDFSSGDFLHPDIDQARLTRLLAGTIADMRASGELPPL